ncbi:MAG: HTTM domain-containing protein [Saprospiraceae bacterium]|nr:HTTM domain-containing protein [Saprospiraceae bacterium]
MLFSTIRFWALGWIEDHYLEPIFHFKYYGFGWVEVMPAWAMYTLHAVMIAASAGVMLGWYYRISIVALFLGFTYTELIDLTYYLNHYYFVSMVLGLMMFLPMHAKYSLDAWLKPGVARATVPLWTIWIIRFQVALVYVYAGFWKMNVDWLINALPLKIWLPAHDTMPVFGPLFAWQYTPWVFSWIGMLYDTTIVGWLMWNKSRPWAYASVVVFHTLTGLLFQIGVFPLVMMGAALVFFPLAWHERLWTNVTKVLQKVNVRVLVTEVPLRPDLSSQRSAGSKPMSQWTKRALIVFIAFQILFPWRYLFYPGNLFWTEEGYRFAWRVMLMEKAGTATFFVKDSKSGREGEVVNSEFLNAHQEKQMSFQPDMVLQFAHFLKKYYAEKGVYNPQVRVETYVTLNARPSKLLIDPTLDLTKQQDTWAHKSWILPPP